MTDAARAMTNRTANKPVRDHVRGDRAIRIGARYPNAGVAPLEIGLAAAARRLEDAGFDSLWTSDHLAMPARHRSAYPFSADRRVPWPADTGWSDAIVALGIAAAATSRIELGTAVLVAPLRSPLVAAKQMASVSVEAAGRCVLGVGVGWLEEEFDAVQVAYTQRGRLLDAWMDVARQVWSGVLGVRDADDLYSVPVEMICRPTPTEPIGILVGGLSGPARRRAGRLGDGWVALQSVDALDPPALAMGIESVREHARAVGRDSSEMRVVLQITGSAGRTDDIAGRISALAEAGVDDIIVDVEWDHPDKPKQACSVLRAAARL